MLLTKIKTQKYWKMPKLFYFAFWPPYWTSDPILNLTKNFSSVKYVSNTISNQKTERKNVQNSLSYGKKQFSAILKKAAILKTCEKARLRKLKCKNFPILKIYNLFKTQNFQNSLKT
jgi:hypothetical protein